jgi:hypothetical protein
VQFYYSNITILSENITYNFYQALTMNVINDDKNYKGHNCSRKFLNSDLRIRESITDPDRVADPGCFSRIPDPDFYPFRIPDPTKTTKEKFSSLTGSRIQQKQQKKYLVVLPFYVVTNFMKLLIILFFIGYRKEL